MDPTEAAVVTVGQISAGTAPNIIPDLATIVGTARTLTDASRAAIQAAIRRRCAGVAMAGDCKLEFDWMEGYPPTINDPAMADYVAQVARKTFGSDRFLLAARPSMGGEDFAYYLQKTPGCFFLVGVEPPGRADPYPTLHSDRYDFTDAAIPVGMRMFIELLRNWPAR